MALSPAPNTQYRDKCLKQIKTLNIEIDRWRTVLKSGMKTLGRISELKREKSGQRDKDNPTHTTIAIASTNHDELLQMQDLCVELSYNCRDLKEVCENLDRIAERLECLAKLDVELTEVANAAQVISKCYRKQWAMNQAVAKNVAKSDCEHSLVLHSAVWIHQPGLDSQCTVAEIIVDHFLDILS